MTAYPADRLARAHARALSRYRRRTLYLYPRHDSDACAEAIELVFRLERLAAAGQMGLGL